MPLKLVKGHWLGGFLNDIFTVTIDTNGTIGTNEPMVYIATV